MVEVWLLDVVVEREGGRNFVRDWDGRMLACLQRLKGNRHFVEECEARWVSKIAETAWFPRSRLVDGFVRQMVDIARFHPNHFHVFDCQIPLR